MKFKFSKNLFICGAILAIISFIVFGFGSNYLDKKISSVNKEIDTVEQEIRSNLETFRYKEDNYQTYRNTFSELYAAKNTYEILLTNAPPSENKTKVLNIKNIEMHNMAAEMLRDLHLAVYLTEVPVEKYTYWENITTSLAEIEEIKFEYLDIYLSKDKENENSINFYLNKKYELEENRDKLKKVKENYVENHIILRYIYLILNTVSLMLLYGSEYLKD